MSYEEFEDIDLDIDEDQALISLSDEQLKIYLKSLDGYISNISASSRILVVSNTEEFIDSLRKIKESYYEDLPDLLKKILEKLELIALKSINDIEFNQMIKEAIRETTLCLDRLGIKFDKSTKEGIVQKYVDNYLSKLYNQINKKPRLTEPKTYGLTELKEETKDRLMEEIETSQTESIHPEFVKKWEEADTMVRKELEISKAGGKKFELSSSQVREEKLKNWIDEWMKYEKSRMKERF